MQSNKFSKYQKQNQMLSAYKSQGAFGVDRDSQSNLVVVEDFEPKPKIAHTTLRSFSGMTFKRS